MFTARTFPMIRTAASTATRRSASTMTQAKSSGLRKIRFGNDSLDIPIEAYPLFAVVAGGLAWSGYALTRHLRKTGRDYRWRPTALERTPENWASRLKINEVI